MAEFKSEDQKVPEIDLRKLDHISALITTFEQKDLKTKGVVSLHYDKKNDYVFIEAIAEVNGKKIMDDVMGFDKDKVLTLCKNVINFFSI